MRVIKALVAFMGILIFVGIGLVAYGLSLDKKATDTPVDSDVPATTPSVPVAGAENTATQGTLAAFGDITIELEEGERLVSFAVEGVQAILYIEGQDGENARLVVVSLTDKKVLGRILLQQNAQQ